MNETAPFAVAFAVSVTCWPGCAAFRIFTRACSSSARPRGRLPSAQVAPVPLGQTENRAVPMPLTCLAAARTVTFLVLARVLQTQMT